MSRNHLLFSLSLFALGCGPSEGDSSADKGLQDSGAQAESGADQGQADAAAEQRCGDCHGNHEDQTPPPALNGSEDPREPGVGAHAVHMSPPALYARVKCSHCHVVPERIDAPGHIDEERPADVEFSGLPVVHAEGSVDAEGRCSVYCHGSQLRIETFKSPPWTEPGSLECDACHGMPPPNPHPGDAEDCGRCHIEVSDEAGEIIDPLRHMDSLYKAPPQAHVVHLGGDNGILMQCGECHDGGNYHGPLKDGESLESTGLCEGVGCHSGEPHPRLVEHWRDYRPFE